MYLVVKGDIQLKKITIIEDDTDIRNMITKFLTNQKYEVCSAPNGREGIELCQKNVTGSHHFGLDASCFKR